MVNHLPDFALHFIYHNPGWASRQLLTNPLHLPQVNPRADKVLFTLEKSIHLKVHLPPHHAHSQAVKAASLCTACEENPSINLPLSPHFFSWYEQLPICNQDCFQILSSQHCTKPGAAQEVKHVLISRERHIWNSAGSYQTHQLHLNGCFPDSYIITIAYACRFSLNCCSPKFISQGIVGQLALLT